MLPSLFKKNPAYAKFFSKWGKTPEDLLCNDQFIQDHGVGNVVVTLGKAVGKIDDPCEANTFAKKIGNKHIKYCLERKHFKVYLKIIQ